MAAADTQWADTQWADMQWADIRWPALPVADVRRATPVAVMASDTAVTVLDRSMVDRSTVGRSTTAALVTTPAMAMATATATATIMDAQAILRHLSAA
jgi:hypothetical protein